jgi:hypothetical protein
MAQKTTYRLITLIFLLSFIRTNAQHLMIDTGKFEVRSFMFAAAGNGVYDNDGEIKATGDYIHSGLQINSGYGLSEGLNILLKMPAVIWNNVSASPETPGGLLNDRSEIHPGDAEIGIKAGIRPEMDFSAAFTLLQGIPTSFRDKQYGLHTGYQDFFTRLFFEVRYSRNPRFIFQGYTGFTNRNKDFGDEFHAGLKGWYIPSSTWKIEASLQGTEPLENGSEEPTIYQYGLYHNNAGILQATGKLYCTVGEIQIFAGYAHTIKGQYIFSGGVSEFGLIFNLTKNKTADHPSTKRKDDKKNAE